MIIIACVDDDLGMMFNHRRQSQDQLLRERIAKLTTGSKLWMNHYSQRQFSTMDIEQLNTDEAFLNEAANGDYCFVENVDLLPYEKWIEKIILFRWNRKYPSDKKFDIPMNGWQITSSTDFVGKSHEKITEEVYSK